MCEFKLRVRQIQLALAVMASLVTPVHAQLSQPASVGQPPTITNNPAGRASSQQSEKALVFNVPPPPRGIGEPGGRVGGGRRSPCEVAQKQISTSEEKKLTALVPMYSNSDLVLGFTTKENPTFWFFVPDTVPFTGEFVLEDSAEEPIYQTQVKLPTRPGVVSFSLPPTVELQVGKPYHWYLTVYCGSETSTFVHGWIVRDSMNPALKSQLDKATPQQQIALYAANGFWHEALTASAELRRTDPKSNDWKALLKAINLEGIASEPVVECCKPGT